MALGSNIEYKASALFQAALDEKSAKEVENRFVKLSKEASEMSRKEFVDAFSSIGQEINNALSKLNLKKIDMEKLIQLPQVEAFNKLGAEFGARFADGFQGAVASGGISSAISEQIKQLEKSRDNLLAKQKSLPKQIKRYNYLSLLEDVEKGDVHAFTLDQIKEMSKGTSADKFASTLLETYDSLLADLNSLNKGTKEYYQTLIKTYEAASNVYKMRSAMDKHPSLVTDGDVLFNYDYESLRAEIGDRLVSGGHAASFSKFIRSQEGLLNKIPAKLSEINSQLNELKLNNPEIINTKSATQGLKTLNEIEAAYKRIKTTRGLGKKAESIDEALNFDPSKSEVGLRGLYGSYTKLPKDTPWEVQYQSLLKFVKLYEYYRDGVDKTHKNMVTAPGNEYAKLYDQLKPMAANAENMLRNVLNMAHDLPLVGMGGAETEKNVEEEQKVTVETQKQANAESQARVEAEAKAQADLTSAEAAEKERLSQEAAAKASQQSAAASEKERASKEASSSYTASGILDNPAFANMFNKAKEKQKANEASVKAAQAELGVTQKTTAELEKQQKLLLYRRVEGNADLNRISGRSVDALYDKSGKPIIQGALEMGFGGFGDGLYTSTFEAAKDLVPGKGSFSFFEFDASAYNLFINKTVEQAQALQSFLLSLQKFVGAGTLLDTSELTHIADMSKDQLFEEAQRIFKNFSMSKQQFDAWIESARVESEAITKLFANGQVPSNRHNFGTRFMQMLGYEGVLNQTGDLDIDGNYQGSVIYDPKDDIKKNARIFNSKEEFVSYIEAEAQARQKNASAIKEEAAAQEHLNAVDNTQQIKSETGAIDEQNGKLKENISLQAQEDASGGAAQAAEENAETEAIKQQNTALQENIDLKNKTNMQIGTGTSTVGTGDVIPNASGASAEEVANLETVRSKVTEVIAAVNTKNKAFYDESQIVGQAVGKENAALIHLKSNVEAITSAVNTKTQAFIKEEMAVRQSIGKENSALIHLQNNVNNVNTSLGGALNGLSGVRMPNLSNATSQANIANETQALGHLQTRINDVIASVRTKTNSFTQEEIAVRQSVGNEIAALIQLRQNVDNVNTAISTLTQGLNTALNNAGAFNGINLNVNAAVDLTTIETTLANILTAIPNAGTGAQNNNAGGQGGGGGQRGVAQHRIDKLESELEKYRSGLDAIGNLTQSYNAELDRLLAELGTLQTSADVTRWRDEFSQFKNIVGMYDNDDKRAVNQMQQTTQKDIIGNYKEIGKLLAQRETATSQEEIDAINNQIKHWAQLAQEKQRNVDVDKSLRRSAVETARREALVTNAVKAEQQSFKEQIKTSQKNARVKKSNAVYDGAEQTFETAASIGGISQEQINRLQEYKTKIDSLKTSIDNASGKTVVSDQDAAQLKTQTAEVDRYTKQIRELIAEHEKLSGDNAEVMGSTNLGMNASADEYYAELVKTVRAYTHGRASIKGYDADTRTLTYTMKTGKGQITTYTASVDRLTKSLASVRGQTAKTMGVFETIGKKISEYATYLTGSMMVMKAISELKRGIGIVKEIDSALTELKKVTDETEESYNNFLNTAAKTADKIGSTTKDIVNSTADWARIGYSIEEAHRLAESTAILLNVSEFSNIEDATSALTSTLQAFGYTAEQSLDVVDVLNEVGNNFAISSDGIATALKDSASSLVAANNSYEEAVALIAAANRVVQDPSSVGAALRTISLRLRGTSVEELQEAGEDTTGVVESKSKLRTKIQGYTGIDILTDSGAYKSTYEILLEISKVWDKLTDTDRAGLLELIAGKTRSNTAASILSNTEDLEDAFKAAQEAEGSALEENEKYLDSIQGRLDLLTNSVQTMWNNAMDSDFLKWVIDLGTTLIKIVDTLGLIPTILAAIGVAKGLKFLFKGFSLTQVIQDISALTMGTKVFSAATRKATMATAAEAVQFHLANSALVQYAVKMKLAQAADIEKMTTTQLLGLSFKALWVSIVGATKALIAFLLTNPVGWIILAIGAIAGGIAIFDHFTKNTEELAEELNEFKSELQDIQSELESVNSELKTTQERIDELLAKDSLSFTEKEELNNLQKQNDELERNLYLLEQRQKRTQKKIEKNFNEIMYGEFNTGTVQMGVSTGITNKNMLDAMISQHQKNVTAEQKAYNDLINAEQRGNEKEIEKARKALEEAEEKTQDTRDYIDQRLTKYLEYADGIDYDVADKETKEYLDYIYDLEDSLNIMAGDSKAKSVAITRISNKEELEDEIEILNEYAESLKNGDSSAKSLIENFINNSPKLKEAIAGITGLELQDLIDFFTMFEKEDVIVEESSITDSLSEISSLEKAYNSLGDAMQEFKEEGTASSGTLEDIKEIFGDIDGFEELYKVLATGEGDVEKSISNVANAYIQQKGMLSDLTEDERRIMIARLKSLGVINAEEVLQSKQVAQEKLNTTYQQYSIDLSNYATAEEAKLMIAQQAGLDLSKINDENMLDLAKKYGVDLSNYATVAEKKIAIAREMAKKEAEIQRNTALAMTNFLPIDSASKEQMKDNIEQQYQDVLKNIPSDEIFSNIHSIVDGYYNKQFDFDFNNQVGIGRDFDKDLTDPKKKELEDEWDNLVNKYENKLALITNERDLIEAEIDKAEARGGKASAQYYEDLIRNSNEEKALLEEKHRRLKEYLDAYGSQLDPETWTEYNNEINETAVAIKECEINTIEWTEALREIDLHYFEQATEEVSRLGEELDFVNSLLEDEEVSDENGNWSSAALTRLGLYTQQMEKAAVEAKMYQDEIDKLNTQYANGELSEEQYQERLSDLVDGQRDAINSYEDAKDGIVELNEARIDAIKDGIDKEIEAYEELIDIKKEELDAERDLYDFKKNVQKQTKDIATLERRIAALSGSNNASDIAERRRLEAELLEAREGLNDTYYEHSRDQQSQALDDEAEAFRESKEKYIEELEATLDDVETLITNSVMDVLTNADTVLAQLNEISDTYGITLSAELTQPWVDAANKPKEYWTNAKDAISGYADFLTGAELGNKFSSTITGFGNQIQTIIDKWNGVKDAADKAYAAQNREINVGGIQTPTGNQTSSDKVGSVLNNTANNSNPNVAALQEILNTVFNSGLTVDGKLGSATTNALKDAQKKMRITADGKYGPDTKKAIETYIDRTIAAWTTLGGSSSIGQGIQRMKEAKKKLPVSLYAKGTIGTTRDQLAITDESWIGEEITLAAGKNGQIQYLKKGSSVLPADISANLVEWGKFNPNMLNVGGGANFNMISNAVNKPELKLDIENFLRCDNVSQDSLPELKRFVNEQMNSLIKQLNYSLKKSGAR